MTVYYKTLCGCSYEKKDLAKDKTTNYRLECPVHPGGIVVNKFIYCATCGKIRFTTSCGGQPSTFCKKHQKVKDLVNRAKSRTTKLPKKVKPNILLITRDMYNPMANADKRAHCINRGICLTTYQWFYSMPCGLCEFYKFKIQNIDGKILNRDYGPTTKAGNHTYL